MSKTPGRKSESSPFRKRQLSSDAKIITILMEKQPLTKRELCEETKISKSAFYRNFRLLEEQHIIKDVDGLYSLWNFKSLEKGVGDALIKIIREKKIVFPNSLVNEIGKPYSELEATAIKMAKKLGLTMQTTTSGETVFLDKKMLGLR